MLPTVNTSESNSYPIVWVKLVRYCELRGENVNAVRSRVRRGAWIEGRHIRRKDGRLYVNLPEADRWVEEIGR